MCWVKSEVKWRTTGKWPVFLSCQLYWKHHQPSVVLALDQPLTSEKWTHRVTHTGRLLSGVCCLRLFSCYYIEWWTPAWFTCPSLWPVLRDVWHDGRNHYISTARCWINVDLMLGQRPRHQINVDSTSGFYCDTRLKWDSGIIVSQLIRNQTLARCWYNVGPTLP